jgi:hypothetical protein
MATAHTNSFEILKCQSLPVTCNLIAYLSLQQGFPKQFKTIKSPQACKLEATNPKESLLSGAGTKQLSLLYLTGTSSSPKYLGAR